MYYVRENVSAEYVIAKSRFIGYVYYCDSEEESNAIRKQLRKEHTKANHICIGLNISEGQVVNRSSDDGEPSGSAGIILLGCLLKHDIGNCLIVVVRYFGGIKLGSGGLIRAYQNTAMKALRRANYYERIVLNKYVLVFDYDLLGVIDYEILKGEMIVEKKLYEVQVQYDLLCGESAIKQLVEVTNGRLQYRFIEKKEVKKDVNCDF